jgi:hypothetical protein
MLYQALLLPHPTVLLVGIRYHYGKRLMHALLDAAVFNISPPNNLLKNKL